MEPLQDPVVSHGICPECVGRESQSGAAVLVVSRARARMIPVLKTLLRGAPQIAIVVDRRARERRIGDAEHDRPVAYAVDRRATDRRRTASLYLV